MYAICANAIPDYKPIHVHLGTKMCHTHAGTRPRVLFLAMRSRHRAGVVSEDAAPGSHADRIWRSPHRRCGEWLSVYCFSPAKEKDGRLTSRASSVSKRTRFRTSGRRSIFSFLFIFHPSPRSKVGFLTPADFPIKQSEFPPQQRLAQLEIQSASRFVLCLTNFVTDC
jgi:hypothetical protein